MKKYKLIAFDMDGTLLTSEKTISSKSIEMIEKAFEQGKEVVLSTGRSEAEIKEYLELLPSLRYVISVSGALVYDCREGTVIYSKAILADTIDNIVEVSKLEDNMIHILTRESICQQSDLEKTDYYKVPGYKELLEKVAIKVDDIYKYIEENKSDIEKINLYHATKEGRERTKERLKNLDIVLVDTEYSALECSSLGVTKGKGLEELCKYLGIEIEDTVAVGDSDNDIKIFETAGLSVAMGNATDNIKKICDVVVSDCDNEGCAQTIEKYILEDI